MVRTGGLLGALLNPLGRFFRCVQGTWLRQEPSLHLDHGSTFPRSSAGSEVSIWEGEGGLRQKLKNQDLDSSLFSFIRTSSRTSCFLHQAVSCSRTLVRERPTGGEQEEASGGEAMASRRIRLAEASAGPAAHLSAAAFAEVWLVNSSALTG